MQYIDTIVLKRAVNQNGVNYEVKSGLSRETAFQLLKNSLMPKKKLSERILFYSFELGLILLIFLFVQIINPLGFILRIVR